MKILFGLLILAAGLSPASVQACSCVFKYARQQLEEAEVVFVGKPVKIELSERASSSKTTWQAVTGSISSLFGAEPAPPAMQRPKFLNAVSITFEVTSYVKGSGPKEVTLRTGYGGGDCGIPMSLSVPYLIYARTIDGMLRTSYCFGSREHIERRISARCSGS